MSKKATIKSVGDVEREKQLARNEYTSNNEYDMSKSYLDNGGLDNDNKERIKQMNRSEYSSNDEYGINKIDI